MLTQLIRMIAIASAVPMVILLHGQPVIAIAVGIMTGGWWCRGVVQLAMELVKHSEFAVVGLKHLLRPTLLVVDAPVMAAHVLTQQLHFNCFFHD